MKKYENWIWVLSGALYGVLMRFLLGALRSDDYRGAMSLAFLFATPFVVGAISIYGLRRGRISVMQMIFYPWTATFFMMLGSAITLLEGSICIAIMSPLFLVISSLGGFAMWIYLSIRKDRDDSVLCIAVLPFALLFTEGNIDLSHRNIEITRSIHVAAPPQVIWQEIMSAKQIQQNELPLSLTHLIGVPKPLEGVNFETKEGEIRYSLWEKGVNFRAKVVEREQNKFIRWEYIFDNDSFPKGSMDEHVAIGGEYFDLNDTKFLLDSLTDGGTKLTIIANYQINSALNFYAVPVSKILGADFIDTILTLYKRRSESAQKTLIESRLH